MADLFPEIEPYKTGHLKVSDIHTLYYEEVGNPAGKPIVFLHGGPGGGANPSHRRYYDPKQWRIILFDQRGCGRSTPHAELRGNTTWDLVADIEVLRTKLGIERWVVAGGSWGSTLALAYAESHPTSCVGLILRGIFLAREKDIRWMYQEGLSRIFPDQYEKYIKVIPPEERGDLVKAFYKRLTSSDIKVRTEAAIAWTTWEASTVKLFPDQSLISSMSEDKYAEAFARIECHYFTNNSFMKSDNQLLDNIHKIKHLPCAIVHGRYDMVCTLDNAWDLKRAWPGAILHIIPDSGHSMSEPGIARKLVEVADHFLSY